jgi:type I restriction enzyme R subunit
MKWLGEIGYETLCGYDVLPESLNPIRADIKEVVLKENLKNSLLKINPKINVEIIKEAIKEILMPSSVSLYAKNFETYKKYVKGIKVLHKNKNGQDDVSIVKIFDFDNPENNEFLAINQFSIQGSINKRRPDIVVFINGLPLIVFELKNPANEDADIKDCFNQIQTYKTDIEDLFTYNLACILSDGANAKLGSLSADFERFMPWKTITGKKEECAGKHPDEVLIKGLLNKEFLLDYLKYFVVFENDNKKIIKKIAGYHQFHAARKAENKTLKALKEKNGKCGVVWHTTGAGKSLTMLCFADKIMKNPNTQNPTIVVVTDRTDLDDQLFDSFAISSKELSPIKIDSRKKLQKVLKDKPSGGVIFTTIQKFKPEQESSKLSLLSDRSNIIIISDEAHRSQYGFEAKIKTDGNIVYGYAKYLRDALPNACFIGFTGTPLEFVDKDTRSVFGDYIDIYDITDAIEDKATVPIYYEARQIPLKAKDGSLIKVDEEIEEIIEDFENSEKEKARWTAVEALVDSDSRIKVLAKDIVDHFENRTASIEGKGMIVCMSRKICVHLYNEIIKLKPSWHSNDPQKGFIKIMMTGSASDTADLQKHIYNSNIKKEIENRFKKPDDELKLIIVRDMWLTGFDVQSLHTMYIDKPMKGHNLIQAISRVNRVFKDKNAGLIVDYIGIVGNLKKAVSVYTENGGKGRVAQDISESAFKEFLSAMEICRDYLHGFDYSKFKTKAFDLLPNAIDFILSKTGAKESFCDACLSAAKAYGLCKNMKEAFKFNDELAFFQYIRSVLIKKVNKDPAKNNKNIDEIIRAIVSNSIITDGVVDVFKSLGLDKPDLSIISEDFLEKVKNIPQKNLAVELLQQLIKGEIKTKFRLNLTAQKNFSLKLQEAMTKYNNGTIETAQVIEELISVAKQANKETKRGIELGLNDEEKAFYDALEQNESAVRELGDDILKKIVKEITECLRKSAKVDCFKRDDVRAQIMILVKRILKKYKYPPDQQKGAVERILEQAEIISEELSGK